MPTITNTRSPKPGVYPFWFWNGVQEESRIAEQLEAMKAGGCRGVVLHSRERNRIPYLSERWFELVVRLLNTAANFVTANPARFGLVKAEIA